MLHKCNVESPIKYGAKLFTLCFCADLRTQSNVTLLPGYSAAAQIQCAGVMVIARHHFIPRPPPQIYPKRHVHDEWEAPEERMTLRKRVDKDLDGMRSNPSLRLALNEKVAEVSALPVLQQ